MLQDLPLDSAAAHRFFVADCFNRAWELKGKPSRTPEADERLIVLGHASLWHWSRRPDCTPRKPSIGYWQASRAYALRSRVEGARRYRELCLEHSRREAPFYLGYAYEMRGGATLVEGIRVAAGECARQARALAARVAGLEERALLVKDPKTRP